MIFMKILNEHILISIKWFIAYSIFIILLILTCILYLHIDNISDDGISACTLKETVHLYCPGCGGTRALGYFFELKFWDSLLANPMILYGFIGVFYYWIKLLLGLIKNGNPYNCPINLTYLIGAPVLLIVFFLVRNIILVAGKYDYLNELIIYWQ